MHEAVIAAGSLLKTMQGQALAAIQKVLPPAQNHAGAGFYPCSSVFICETAQVIRCLLLPKSHTTVRTLP